MLLSQRFDGFWLLIGEGMLKIAQYHSLAIANEVIQQLIYPVGKLVSYRQRQPAKGLEEQVEK